MWNWFNCYLSGRHEYAPWCEPGTIFLRCMHCGRRSSGWAIDEKPHARTATVAALPRSTPPVMNVTSNKRVLPFERAAAG
jgi:hypothetical protein